MALSQVNNNKSGAMLVNRRVVTVRLMVGKKVIATASYNSGNTLEKCERYFKRCYTQAGNTLPEGWSIEGTDATPAKPVAAKRHAKAPKPAPVLTSGDATEGLVTA